MAEKRMFTKKITDSDAFTELPPTTQALYFHLCMSADDDGFNNTIRRAMFNAHADANDLELLINKKFVLVFDDSSVIVIKHWRMHNTLSAYRYKETAFESYKALLKIKPNNAYTFGDGEPLDDAKLVEMANRQAKDEQKTCLRQTKDMSKTSDRQAIDMSKTNNRHVLDEQKTSNRQAIDNHSIEENSIDKNSIDKNSIEEYTAAEPPHASETPLIDNTEKPQKHKYGIFNHVLLLDDEMSKLVSEYGLVETQQAIKYLDEYIEMKGVKYKSHYLALKKWVYDAVKEQKQRSQKIQPAKLNSFNNVSSLQRESPQFDTIAELIENGAFD